MLCRLIYSSGVGMEENCLTCGLEERLEAVGEKTKQQFNALNYQFICLHSSSGKSSARRCIPHFVAHIQLIPRCLGAEQELKPNIAGAHARLEWIFN